MKKIKTIMLAAALVLSTACAMAGSKNTMPNVTYPVVGNCNTEYCKIASVSHGSTITMVKLIYNTAKVSFENVKEAYIKDAAHNKTYKLKFVQGLKSGQEVVTDGQRFVTLVFPKLKKNPTTVDIIEEDGNGFQFLDVDITQSGPVQSVFDKDALETELNKKYDGTGMNFKQVDE